MKEMKPKKINRKKWNLTAIVVMKAREIWRKPERKLWSENAILCGLEEMAENTSDEEWLKKLILKTKAKKKTNANFRLWKRKQKTLKSIWKVRLQTAIIAARNISGCRNMTREMRSWNKRKSPVKKKPESVSCGAKMWKLQPIQLKS